MSPLNTTSTKNEIVTTTDASLNASLGPALSQTQFDVPLDDLTYFVAYVAPRIDFVLVPFGLSTCIVNTIVYWRLGFGESANITFMAMSAFNLIAWFIHLVKQILSAVEIIASMATLVVISTYSRGFAYVQIQLIIVYLSLERCICIMLPLKVRDILTPRRVILINVIIAIFGFVCYIPVWLNPRRLPWLYDPNPNLSQWDILSLTFIGIAVPASAEIVIVVCTGIMLHGINQSVKFRQRCATVRGSGTAKSVKRIKIMTRKDLKLTKVVVLLAMKNCISILPSLVGSFLRAVIPDMDWNKQYEGLYEMFYSLGMKSRVINCLTDIFVYYNASSKYRKQFRVLFSRSGFVKRS